MSKLDRAGEEEEEEEEGGGDGKHVALFLQIFYKTGRRSQLAKAKVQLIISHGSLITVRTQQAFETLKHS